MMPCYAAEGVSYQFFFLGPRNEPHLGPWPTLWHHACEAISVGQ